MDTCGAGDPIILLKHILEQQLVSNPLGPLSRCIGLGSLEEKEENWLSGIKFVDRLTWRLSLLKGSVSQH